jgi:hypothetical protein
VRQVPTASVGATSLHHQSAAANALQTQVAAPNSLGDVAALLQHLGDGGQNAMHGSSMQGHMQAEVHTGATCSSLGGPGVIDARQLHNAICSSAPSYVSMPRALQDGANRLNALQSPLMQAAATASPDADAYAEPIPMRRRLS